MAKPKLTQLRSQLMGAMVANYENKSFLAESSLRRILKETDLEGCLREGGVGPGTLRKEVHEAIQDGGYKVFAILVLMEKQPVTSLEHFLNIDQMNTGRLDSRLPIMDLNQLMTILGNDMHLALDFDQLQWAVMCPLFREDRSDRKFHRQTILPFIHREKIGSGASSTVYQVTFHDTHHAFRFATPGQAVKLACKEVSGQISAGSFTNERQTLILLRQIRHPNMVQLLASFSIVDDSGSLRRCLLFPLADQPLKAILDSDKKLIPEYFVSYEEYLDQLHRLSSALEHLHNYADKAEGVSMKGSHFDLAPRNILVQKGRLLLADFGLARMRSLSSDSATPFQGGAGDFLAPECTINGISPNYLHGRKSDVWSFGGILSTMTVFMKLGNSGIKEYRMARRYEGNNGGITYRFHAEGLRNAAAEAWLTKFKRDLSAVEGPILELVNWMLSPDPEERPSMEEATTYLYLLAQRARFRAIDLQLAELAAKRPSMQLQMEASRFSIWSVKAALAIHRQPMQDLRPEDEQVSWLVANKTKLETISNTLQDMLQEAHFLLAGVDQENPVVPVYSRLRDLNQALWNLAPLRERTDMFSQLENTVEQLYDERNIRPRQLSTDAPTWERRATFIAMMRYMTKYPDESATPSRETSGLKIPESLVQVTESVGRTVVRVEGNPKPALCEWISYDLRIAEHVPDRFIKRVASIARQFAVPGLPTEFHVLSCRGYFHDMGRSRFGLVLDYPPSASAASPVTLHEAMKRYSRPPLGNLFAIARTIVNSLHYCHRAGWVHKNISSHSVLFFDAELTSPSTQPPGTKHLEAPMSLPSPYLVGFNHSRPNDTNTFTSGTGGLDKLYLHPDYASPKQPRFQLGYDYYSLGLLLIEIGMWEPMTRSSLLDGRLNDIKLHELRNILQNSVPLLSRTMGTIYKNAVQLCLSDEFVRLNDFLVKQEFGERVVQELERCCV